ncbi:hypothetical protein ACFE04_024678 [Oxalis oulophora]
MLNDEELPHDPPLAYPHRDEFFMGPGTHSPAEEKFPLQVLLQAESHESSIGKRGIATINLGRYIPLLAHNLVDVNMLSELFGTKEFHGSNMVEKVVKLSMIAKRGVVILIREFVYEGSKIARAEFDLNKLTELCLEEATRLPGLFKGLAVNENGKCVDDLSQDC